MHFDHDEVSKNESNKLGGPIHRVNSYCHDSNYQAANTLSKMTDHHNKSCTKKSSKDHSQAIEELPHSINDHSLLLDRSGDDGL